MDEMLIVTPDFKVEILLLEGAVFIPYSSTLFFFFLGDMVLLLPIVIYETDDIKGKLW